jgi:hypothetical protein
MVEDWVIEEMRTAGLEDKRLNQRLMAVLSQLAARPTASIPAACGGHAEMTAAYRFFDNEHATFDRILQPHRDTTRQRIATQPVAILAQDTTEIDLTRPSRVVAGAGPLDGNSRVGVLLHLLHAFTPDGTPLGTLHALPWTREDEPKNAQLTRAQRAAIPLEEKESFRWVTTVHQAHDVALACPQTQCVCVSDSEGDIYEAFVACQEMSKSLEWIVRACQNRALVTDESAESPEKHLREQVLKSPVLFTQSLSVRGRKAKVACETRGRRQPRESRQAEVLVRAASVTLRPPYRPNRKLSAVTLNAVLVCEEHPPAGEEPIEWLLLTSLPIESEEAVRLIVQYYCVRWMIEVFFRVLKVGCRVEERQFEQVDRLLTCLSVYLIVAWRTLYACRLSRSCPDISCEAVFEPAEWKATWRVVHGEDPPVAAPALAVMVQMAASLGGYVPRKTSPPGPQTLWIGMQRTRDFALCWKTFGPEARQHHTLM